MKNKIFLLVTTIFFMTGCTCEYNLTISENKYQEEINIIAEDQEEISNLNYNWKIPINKEEYNIVGTPESPPKYTGDLYNYKINNNILTFSYDFKEKEYTNSSAVSTCYDKLNVIEKNYTIIISTSIKAGCFESKPGLNKIIVNINVDREVISSDSDKTSGKKYTWYIDKNNYNNKPINIVLSDETDNKQENIPKNSNENNTKNTVNNKTDYNRYILSGILLVIMIPVYFIFNKIKNKNNKMDD